MKVKDLMEHLAKHNGDLNVRFQAMSPSGQSLLDYDVTGVKIDKYHDITKNPVEIRDEIILESDMVKKCLKEAQNEKI